MANLQDLVKEASRSVEGILVDGMKEILDEGVQEVIVLYKGQSFPIQVSNLDLQTENRETLIGSLIGQLQQFKSDVDEAA